MLWWGVQKSAEFEAAANAQSADARAAVARRKQQIAAAKRVAASSSAAASSALKPAAASASASAAGGSSVKLSALPALPAINSTTMQGARLYAREREELDAVLTATPPPVAVDTKSAAAEHKPKPKASPSAQVPKEFLCAINRHIMSDPVISPQGHVFEKVSARSHLPSLLLLCC